MESNDYALEIIVRARLTELRTDAERYRRVEAARPAAPSLPEALGRALICLRSRLLRMVAHVAPLRATPKAASTVHDPGVIGGRRPL